jgi:hypothetical protein
MFGCCCNQVPLSLIRYRGVQVYANPTQVYQVDGFRTPWGWYPSGATFNDQLVVMKLVVDKAVALCNSLPLPSTYYTAPFPPSVSLKRYNLNHTAPVFGLPGLLITNADNLIAEETASGNFPPALNSGLSGWAGTAWTRPAQYAWQIVASKVELTFNQTTQICVEVKTCVSSNSTKTTQSAAAVHLLNAPDFDIVANRLVGGCGSTSGARAIDFTPGQC